MYVADLGNMRRAEYRHVGCRYYSQPSQVYQVLFKRFILCFFHNVILHHQATHYNLKLLGLDNFFLSYYYVLSILNLTLIVFHII